MSEFQHKRADKVAQLLQQELASLLVEGLKDPRVGFATVTEVKLTDDLRTARVYISVYGTDEQQKDTLAGLRAATSFLRRELARRIRLRYAPDLSFFVDESLENAARLEQLFTAIATGDEAPTPETTASPVVPVTTDRSTLGDSARSLEEQRESERAQQAQQKKRQPRRERRYKRK